MSIQWNKEVKMKDVKKFLNQEISLGEIDYHKCLQVSLMVVAFGIIPAFTYGTVLGTLEGQRVALMGEVSSLKAETISATRSSVPPTTPNGSTVGTSTVADVKTDKTVYELGSTTTVYFSNSISTTTNIVSIDLYSNGALVQRLATMNPYLGQNKFSFKVATSSLERGNLFFVRVTPVKTGVGVDSNKFQINFISKKPMTVSVIGKPSATVIPGYESGMGYSVGGSDIGVYRFRLKITANDADRYVLTNKISSGFSTGLLGTIVPGKAFVDIYSFPNESDTEYGYKISKGTDRFFDIVITSIPFSKVQRGFNINAVNYANSAEGARTLKDATNISVTGDNFSTDIIQLLSSREFKG